MAYSKKEAFESDDKQVAIYAKALSHPARVAILKMLASKNTCMCGDIVDELPLSQSTVSQHLKELKLAGLVCGEVEGPKVCYCINNNEWEKAQKIFEDFFWSISSDEQCTC